MLSHCFLCDVTYYPFPDLNGGLVKLPLKLDMDQ